MRASRRRQLPLLSSLPRVWVGVNGRTIVGNPTVKEELLTAKDAKVMQSARRKLWFFFADLAVFLSELCG